MKSKAEEREAEASEPAEQQPKTLNDWVAGILSMVESIMFNDFKAEEQAYNETKLSWYPIRANQLRKQIQALTERKATILKPFDEILLSIRQAVAEEQDEKGKARYSNEDKRQAEMAFRQTLIPGYADAQLELTATGIAIERLRINLQFVEEQFAARKLEIRANIQPERTVILP